MPLDNAKTTQLALNDLFGTRWKTAFAQAMGVSRDTVHRFDEPFASYAQIVVEFLEGTHPNDWPDRFDKLRDMHMKQTPPEPFIPDLAATIRGLQAAMARLDDAIDDFEKEPNNARK